MAEIIESRIPSSLYRYRSLANAERELEAIENGNLFCGSSLIYVGKASSSLPAMR